MFVLFSNASNFILFLVTNLLEEFPLRKKKTEYDKILDFSLYKYTF